MYRAWKRASRDIPVQSAGREIGNALDLWSPQQCWEFVSVFVHDPFPCESRAFPEQGKGSNEEGVTNQPIEGVTFENQL